MGVSTTKFMKKTLFVTFPRSGHHLVVDILQKYYGEEMRYCEMYSHCSRVWCTDSSTTHQKTHDFGLDVPTDLDVRYIIQIRNAEDAIASWYKSAIIANWTNQNWKSFLENGLSFRKRFLDKWIYGPTGHSITIVTYENLIADPLKEIKSIIGYPCDDNKLKEVLNQFTIKQKHSFKDYDFTK